MNTPLRTLLVEGAERLGISLDEVAIERFSKYFDLLQLWGSKINLTSRREDEEIVVYHFLDSLAAVPFLVSTSPICMVDLGAGAGLPSLPLKFVLPDLTVLLAESVRKKVAFCQEVIRATGIAGVRAEWGRGEDLGKRPEHRRSYDCAVSRALGQSADVARLALPFLVPGGRILLYKGEPDANELRSLDSFCVEQGAEWRSQAVSIPFLEAARTLIVIGFPLTAPG